MEAGAGWLCNVTLFGNLRQRHTPFVLTWQKQRAQPTAPFGGAQAAEPPGSPPCLASASQRSGTWGRGASRLPGASGPCPAAGTSELASLANGAPARRLSMAHLGGMGGSATSARPSQRPSKAPALFPLRLSREDGRGRAQEDNGVPRLVWEWLRVLLAVSVTIANP